MKKGAVTGVQRLEQGCALAHTEDNLTTSIAQEGIIAENLKNHNRQVQKA